MLSVFVSIASASALAPTSAPIKLDVLIVGGGPAGLAAATSLSTAGLSVTLVESRVARFETARAYLYLVDRRGQRWTEDAGLTQTLCDAGVSNADCKTRQAPKPTAASNPIRIRLAVAASACPHSRKGMPPSPLALASNQFLHTGSLPRDA